MIIKQLVLNTPVNCHTSLEHGSKSVGRESVVFDDYSRALSAIALICQEKAALGMNVLITSVIDMDTAK